MATQLNLSKLSLRDALDLAVIIEDQAKERYEELAAQMDGHHTMEAAEFFRFMVANEAKHGDELRRQRQKMFGNQPVEVDEQMVPQVESPDYDEVRAFMSARQALNVALVAETRAYEFFVEAIAHVKDRDVRKLFAELRDEEVEHKQLVQAQLDKLPPNGKGDTDDYVDEPVPQ